MIGWIITCVLILKSTHQPNHQLSNTLLEIYSGMDKTVDKINAIRVNKCLSGLSRRAADEAINENRVTINNNIAKCGDRVKFGDVVKLDGKRQSWEQWAKAKFVEPSKVLEDRSFVYLKYWKPQGVTCTSDLQDSSNIIAAGKFNLFPQRLFTVGRLDKDSTGIIDNITI
jgi:23S rRNA pseudouridine2604 synthase